jgi:Spy/CpxP family protein refolding chaperone
MIDDVISPTPGGPERGPRRSRAALYALVVVLAVGAAGALASAAMSAGLGFGPEFGHGWWHHRHGMMDGRLSPAEIEDRADRGVRHFAIDIDATPEQQEKLRALVASALKDLLPMRDELRGGRQRLVDLLSQSTVNRDEVEKVRAEQMALADRASKRIVQALADAADVLTPEQREKVRDRLEKRWSDWREE